MSGLGGRISCVRTNAPAVPPIAMPNLGHQLPRGRLVGNLLHSVDLALSLIRATAGHPVANVDISAVEFCSSPHDKWRHTWPTRPTSRDNTSQF